MKFYLVKTPNSIQYLWKKYVWRFFTDKKEIYLTFDDGPTPTITNWILDTLKEYNAKATFFCVGKNVVHHPKIMHRIISEGHALGNHTHDHKNGYKTASNEYIENVLIAEKAIEKSTLNAKYSTQKTVPLLLFRPPYGKIKRKQANSLRSLGYQIIMWSVLSADFDTGITKEKCLQNVLKNAKAGSIIVFHDSIKASEKLQFTLPKTLAYYAKKGYIFKAIG
jgi:peptidoglycan/xylan/chitin deacetylase (PgdA/CDA1 family)